VAVTAVQAAPASIRPGESAKLSALVLNASPLPIAKVAVRLHLEAGDKARDLEQTTDIDGGSTATVEFTLKELPEGLWRGQVEVSAADELPFDDRRYLALSVAPPTRVLLVDGDPGRSPVQSETYFLQAALQLAPPGERYAKTPFDTRTVDFSTDASLPDLKTTAAVVLANVGTLVEPDARRLAEFVARGGGLLVLTGDRVRPESLRSLDAVGLGVGEVLGPATANELPWRLERWETSHPVFRPFEDPEHGDLRRPAFTTITRIKPDPSARVIARFRGDEPALLERTLGRGKVLWFASAGDRDWSDWPRGRLYVPMVHQMLAYVSGLAEGGMVRQDPARGDRPPGIVDSETDGLVHVVNADPFESETARCTPREFADHFGFRLPEPAAPAVAQKGSLGPLDDRLRGDEIWPWLALTLLGFLLVENFLANRTAA
jgi:hypothetical protein